MMQVDVIALAAQVGRPAGMGHYKLSNNDEILAFARIVRQATAEDCAKLCDELTFAVDNAGNKYHRPAHATYCAAAIRAKFAAKEETK